MKKIMMVLPLILLGCKFNAETSQPQTYSCIGEITENNTEIKCRERFEKFTHFMLLGNKVEISAEGCAWVYFNYKKLEKIEDTGLNLQYV